MPTYEYQCEACDHRFEEFQSITAKPIRKCPKCGKLKVNRLIGTGAGMIFKGSGFYITDYRSENYKNAAKADGGAAAGGSTAGGNSDAAAKSTSGSKSESSSSSTSASGASASSSSSASSTPSPSPTPSPSKPGKKKAS